MLAFSWKTFSRNSASFRLVLHTYSGFVQTSFQKTSKSRHQSTKKITTDMCLVPSRRETNLPFPTTKRDHADDMQRQGMKALLQPLESNNCC